MQRVRLPLSGLFIAGFFVQVYLAGRGAFGAASYSAHKDFGDILHFVPILILIVTLAGRATRNRTDVILDPVARPVRGPVRAGRPEAPGRGRLPPGQRALVARRRDRAVRPRPARQPSSAAQIAVSVRTAVSADTRGSRPNA